MKMKSPTKNELLKIARDFWFSTPVKYSIPCDLAYAAQSILPINITSLPNLALEPVQRWFESHNISFPIKHNGRSLCACLVAYEGMGMIFLDGTDSEPERRFSLAHELAHFILEYKINRQKAVKALGDGILDVLDGKRKATVSERLDGIFSGVDIGPFVHTMERSIDGMIPTSQIQNSENMADILALELVAPHKQIKTYMSDKWTERKTATNEKVSQKMHLVTSGYQSTLFMIILV